MKTVFFVNGSLRQALRVLPGLRGDTVSGQLRVVVGPWGKGNAREEVPGAAGLWPEQVVVYSAWAWPLVWLRLMWFLGWSRPVRVLCLAAPDSRAVKLLAFALRGRVAFLLPDDLTLSLSLPRFLWLAFKTLGRRRGDICLVGTASRGRLERILADLRRRYPGVPVHALLRARGEGLQVETSVPLSVRNLLACCRRRPRLGTLVIPCTGEGQHTLKLLACLLPLGYREIYNENGDFCSARELHVLMRHCWWRMRDAWWGMRDAWWRLNRALRTVPNRVTVLGAASPSRLAAIVADLRRRRPGAPCHGFLPPSLSAEARLFDSATILRASSLETYRAILSCAFGRKRSGYLVVPFTGEGYRLLKVVFWLLPLGWREFHNENGDFCRARDLGALLGHLNRRLGDWLTRRPPRVTVLGSASGLYLKTMVADIRRRYPGAPVHGLLPGRLVVPVAHLFDSYTVLRPLSARFWRDLVTRCMEVFWRDLITGSMGRRRCAHFVIPCTNEGYTSLKLLGFGLPLRLREIYNENGDAYLPREVRMLLRHTLWRLRHRIFWQALTERHGRLWLLHAAHLLLYPFRLAAGAMLLAGVRLRTFRSRPGTRGVTKQAGFREEPVDAHSQLERGAPVVSGDP